MMSSTLGAPFGGTTRGGHQGFDSAALCLITPPNCGGGGGICFPSMVVVPLGEPGSPVACCAAVGAADSRAISTNAATPSAMLFPSFRFMPCPLFIRSSTSLHGAVLCVCVDLSGTSNVLPELFLRHGFQIVAGYLRGSCRTGSVCRRPDRRQYRRIRGASPDRF